MTTLLYSHPDCALHDPGAGHPECPDRLRAVLAAFETEEFARLERRQAPKIEIAEIERVHRRHYIEAVFAKMPVSGQRHLDPDTAISPASGEAALRAVGAVVAAVDAVIGGEADNAFCAVRPPGHHAETDRAMGFCLFNNVAIAARHGQAVCGLKRVAVVDFDVHHGNGTQAAFEGDAGLFYASSHQLPCFPGTGASTDRGRVGNMVNVQLAPGAGSAEFRKGYEERVFPALRDFSPELLLISAGFDAHASDPLAQVRLVTEDYGWVARNFLDIAAECCQGRVVATLEGGYDMAALAAAAAALARAFMDV